MTSRSVPAIDPAGVAARLGADGYGIVCAVLAGGIEASHPHFQRHANFELPPPLRHRDFTLREGEDGAAAQSPVDEDLLAEEALIDIQGHGTHVAGIVAGHSDPRVAGIEWHVGRPLSGVAPRCKLMSLKVVDDNGGGNELTVLAALEHLRALDAAAGSLLVHVVLMPLGFEWDMANYACGQSPICRAIDGLVDQGAVVVVPAGNQGMKGFGTITDPGNAERAITVGATHRFRAQDYGASYFSSRGPTLDGRFKPDLLAPGEKIESAAPGAGRSRARATTSKRGRSARAKPVAETRVMDGTSMAAAHVAGAVAAILSVRTDLIGKPQEVKKLLLDCATDLGRDRYCQGRGALDLGRALDRRAGLAHEPPTVPPPEPITPLVPAASLPLDVGPSAQPDRGAATGKRFAVAFSFAGEHDDYVRRIVKALREVGRLPRSSVFYHKHFEAELSRPDLDLYLQEIYGSQSELLVVMLSAEYEKKEWTGLEWRALRELIKKRAGHAVMPIRFDETHIPGLFSLDGYSSAAGRTPEEIADLILDRLFLNRERGLV